MNLEKKSFSVFVNIHAFRDRTFHAFCESLKKHDSKYDRYFVDHDFFNEFSEVNSNEDALSNLYNFQLKSSLPDSVRKELQQNIERKSQTFVNLDYDQISLLPELMKVADSNKCATQLICFFDKPEHFSAYLSAIKGGSTYKYCLMWVRTLYYLFSLKSVPVYYFSVFDDSSADYSQLSNIFDFDAGFFSDELMNMNVGMRNSPSIIESKLIDDTYKLVTNGCGTNEDRDKVKKRIEQSLALFLIPETVEANEGYRKYKDSLEEVFQSRSWRLVKVINEIIRLSYRRKFSPKHFFKGSKPFPLDTIIRASSDPENLNNKVCLFAHFDQQAEIKQYVWNYLSHINNSGYSVIFISTASIEDESILRKLDSIVAKSFIRKNIGYDFGSWRVGIDYITPKIDNIDTLMLANDSVYGPLNGLGKILHAFKTSAANFYGATDSYEVEYHIQSYFMLLDRHVINSQAWHHFWNNIRVYNDKADIIRKLEVKLSQVLLEAGYKLDSFCKSREVAHQAIISNHYYTDTLKVFRSVNLTHVLWDALITEHEYPFIKRELIEVNPLKIKNLSKIKDIVAETNYDYSYLSRN